MRRGERSKRRRTRETCACRQGDSRRLRHGAAHGAVGLGSVPQGGSGGHYVRGLRRTHVKNGPAEYKQPTHGTEATACITFDIVDTAPVMPQALQLTDR